MFCITHDDGGFSMLRTGEEGAAPDSDLVAHVWNDDYLPLLATAPEILKELEGFVSSLTGSLRNRDTMLTINHDALVARIRTARAAIAKATTTA